MKCRTGRSELLTQRVQQRVWVGHVSVSARMGSTFAVLRVCRRAPLPDTQDELMPRQYEANDGGGE